MLDLQFNQLFKRRNITIHTEDTIRDQQASAFSAMLHHQQIQGRSIIVGIAHHPGTGQQGAINNTGMVETVREYDIAPPDQCSYDAGIGSIAAVKQQSCLGTLKAGNPGLQQFMQFHGAGNKPGCTAGGAEALCCQDRGPNKSRMVG